MTKERMTKWKQIAFTIMPGSQGKQECVFVLMTPPPKKRKQVSYRYEKFSNLTSNQCKLLTIYEAILLSCFWAKVMKLFFGQQRQSDRHMVIAIQPCTIISILLFYCSTKQAVLCFLVCISLNIKIDINMKLTLKFE